MHQRTTNSLINFQQLQAKFGGRSRSTIYRDIERGLIPSPKKFGARLYWLEADIDKVISTNVEVS